MQENRIQMNRLLPVLMSFFVMSFVDLVGIGVDRVGEDMHLSATLAQLIPSAAFLWFLLLSVPVGIMQARIGKRLMLNIGMAITAGGLLLPYFSYTFPMVLAGFALLGIGNTIVQVSANPLLIDVVPGNRAPSFLSLSQFVKAIGSMLGAPLATVFASQFGDWKLMFLVFGVVSILSVLWLGSVKIEESKTEDVKVSLSSAFKLLGNFFILLMVLSIFFVVGIDVGFNSNSGIFLNKQFGILPEAAASGRSVYFFGRMLGTFAGALLLTKVAPKRFLIYSAVMGIAVLLLMLNTTSTAMAWVLVFLTGLAVSNIFPLVFSIAVERFPTRTNEISGLMMMAICGGAVIPPLMGMVSDIGSVTGSMYILVASMVFILLAGFYSLRK